MSGQPLPAADQPHGGHVPRREAGINGFCYLVRVKTPDLSPHSRQLDPSHPSFGAVILFLTVVGFAVSLNIRVTDPILPTLAAEFSTTPGKVAIVAVFYAVAHGFMQLAGGPVGDRYGKLRVVTLAAYAAAGTTAATALASSIPELAAMRLLSGATAAIVFPLAFAWVGDVVPYNERQVVIARMFGGAMLGGMLGQAVSGLSADFLGWRAVFLLTGAVFLISAVGLSFNHGLHQSAKRTSNPGLFADVVAPFVLLKQSETRLVLGVCAAEGFFVMSTATFLGAYLHDRFDLTYSQIGLVLALFGGGGLFYTLNARWLILRLGERGLVTYGGAVFSVAYLGIALTPFWQAIPLLLFVSGLSLLMLHNTLQLRASQMAPESRGSAMSAFAASFFFGQLAGVALCGPIYDRVGGAPLFAAGAAGFAIVALIYWARLPSLEART